MVTRLNFEKRKFILKFYWKFKTQLKCKDSSGKSFKQIHMCKLLTYEIRFAADGTIQNVHKKCSRRLQTWISSTTRKGIKNISPEFKKICTARDRNFKIKQQLHFFIGKVTLQQ